ncbi:hypothetical protein FQR65_LT15950 [Abscondita terminalis]|nr:hypothetical protein FQR65_LT15950 [Abscondita terminalis]
MSPEDALGGRPRGARELEVMIQRHVDRTSQFGCFRRGEVLLKNGSTVTKKHFCVKCNKLVTKFARHLEQVHKEDDTVKIIAASPKGSIQHKRKIEQILKMEMFNTEGKNTKDSVIACRRSTRDIQYEVCGYCKGYYSKNALRKHILRDKLLDQEKRLNTTFSEIPLEHSVWNDFNNYLWAAPSIMEHVPLKDTNLGKINRDYWAKESIKENVGSSSNCGIEDNSPSSLLLDHNYATEEVVVLADEEIETGGGASSQLEDTADEAGLATNEVTQTAKVSSGSKRTILAEEVVVLADEEIETGGGASSQLEDTADEAGLATNEVTQTAKVSSGSKRTILARNKARTRRTSIQRQGLAYLQEYENTQNELKRKDQELLEEKLKIEEGKLELEKKRLELEERKLVLREFENTAFREEYFNNNSKSLEWEVGVDENTPPTSCDSGIRDVIITENLIYLI